MLRRAAAASIAVLTCLAFSADAGAAIGDSVGALIQLNAPHRCIAESAAPTNPCGDQVNGGRIEGGLEGAQSVAIAPNGRNVYVASSSGAISTFDRDTTTGFLTYKGCIKDPTSTEACAANSPVAGELMGAKSVALDPLGNYVYVAASTSASTGAITVFHRDATTGAISPVLSEDGCVTQDMDVPGCHSVVAGIEGVSFLAVRAGSVYALAHDRSTLVRLTRNPDTGGLDLTDPVNDCFRGQGSPETDCGADATPASETKGLKGPVSLAIPSGPTWAKLYVASREDNAVAVFTRGSGSEQIDYQSCVRGTLASSCDETTAVAGLDGAQGIAVNGGNLYVAAGPGSAASTGNTLATFVPALNGDLTQPSQCFRDPNSTAEAACDDVLPGIPGLRGAADLALSAEGDFLYVAATTGSDVAEFSRSLDPADNGALTPLPDPDECVGEQSVNTDCNPSNRGAYGIQGASSLVTAPGGTGINSNHVYVVSPADDAIAEFRIERAPVCTSLTITAQHDQRRGGALGPRCTDVNRDLLTFQIVTQPTNGTLTVNTDWTFTYTPNPHFSGGTDSFTFRAHDGHVFSNTATITINVPPVARDHTPPTVTRSGIAAQMTRAAIVGTGISFTERANERVRWRNELLGKPRELGTGSSSSYSVVLDTDNFGFRFAPPRAVNLKMTNAQLPPAGRTFHVKVRITATDGNGNVTVKTRNVTVRPG